MNNLFDIYYPLLSPIGYRRLEPWEFLPWKEVHFSRLLVRLKACRKKFKK